VALENRPFENHGQLRTRAKSKLIAARTSGKLDNMRCRSTTNDGTMGSVTVGGRPDTGLAARGSEGTPEHNFEMAPSTADSAADDAVSRGSPLKSDWQEVVGLSIASLMTGRAALRSLRPKVSHHTSRTQNLGLCFSEPVLLTPRPCHIKLNFNYIESLELDPNPVRCPSLLSYFTAAFRWLATLTCYRLLGAGAGTCGFHRKVLITHYT